MIAEKKGMGMIGIFLMMAVVVFFFTMFYVVLNQFFINFIPTLANNQDTFNFFNSTHVPIWHALVVFFLLSLLIWGIIQSQNPFNQLMMGGVWLVIIVSWFTYSLLFVALDEWIVTGLPGMLPMAPEYYQFYTNFVITIWRAMPWAIACILVFIGAFIAPTVFERSGQVYVGGAF